MSRSGPEGAVPEHVAIIMDGNGRWAKRRLLGAQAGHRAGAQNLRKLAASAEGLGIKYLTVFAFSTENWARPAEEVETLMGLIREYIGQYISDSKKNEMRVSVIGERSRLAEDLRAKITDLENLTAGKKGLHVVIALNYGGRDDIVRAAKKISKGAAAGNVDPDGINERAFASYLDTGGLPDPDLLIRTSGEFRLSNFLLWQCAYSEIFVSPKLWPDFDENDLQNAIAQYQKRDRRYGSRS